MLKGCLLSAILFVLTACLILYSTRSLQIDRGLKLDSYVAGDFTYDVWSYGNWVASQQGGIHVSTFSAPYTLVLAIQPDDSDVDSIEILAASITDESGNQNSVLDRINKTNDDVESRSGAAIQAPYAVFTFKSLLDSNDTITLEIEFRTNASENSDTIRQSLEIPGFESKTRSFTFWDVMSSA